MSAVLSRFRQARAEAEPLDVAGMATLCDPSGALFLPADRLLVVSDLHLEKGAAFARRGMMLPPYDTLATLSLLGLVIERYDPTRVVCLGDSFHDRAGADLMPAPFREALRALMSGRDWIWIRGNHDPDAPVSLGGTALESLALGPLLLRHEPAAGACPGEVAGHLHPVARVAGGGRSVRGACFATDGSRLIMPAFGVTTGGLNVLDRAFDGLLHSDRARAYVIGQSRIYPIVFKALSRG